MKKAIYLATILCFFFTAPAPTVPQDKDCPDCPKTVTSGTTLDPRWKEFKAPPLVPGELPDCHRVQFGKQDCAECHKRETPVSYNEWLGSKHGINNVTCGTCHGDVNNYRARPGKEVCVGCHSAQVRDMPKAALVTNCSFCHKEHWSTVHKIRAYEKFAPGRERRFNVPGF